jgi:soluble lytic murein transglycosylase-like protein
MTSARSEPKRYRTRRQTAESSGCLSGFLLPPLAAVCVSALLITFVAGFTNTPAEPVPPAESTQSAPQAVALPVPVAGSGVISTLFTREIQFWAPSLSSWAAQNNVDINLAATVMQIESCGNPAARSSAGAMGLFQVMPFHFARSENAYDPDTNARRGLDYLRRSFEAAGGNARLALAGYNGGIGVIKRAESAWPAETIRYVRWGYPIYMDAAQNAGHSAGLDAWITATGGSLCRKASQQLGISP